MKSERTYKIFILICAFCLLVTNGCGGDPVGTTDKSETSSTAQDLQNKSFLLTSGEVLNENLGNTATTLTFGEFTGNYGDFAITTNDNIAMGTVTIGSCPLVVTFSTFPIGQGPQVGDLIELNPCNVEDDGATLILTSKTSGLIATAEVQISPAQVDISDIAATFTGNSNLAAMAVHKNGERLTAITQTDPSGNGFQVIGGIWTSPNGQNIVVYTGEEGLPRLAVFDNGVIAFYSNYTSSTVDIAFVFPDNTLKVVRDVPIDPLLVAKIILLSNTPNLSSAKLLAKTQLQRPYLSKLSDVMKMVSFAVSSGSCAYNLGLVGTGIGTPLAVIACGSTFLSTLNNLLPDNPALQNWSDGFSIIGCGTGPLAGDLWGCVAFLLDAGGRAVGAIPDTSDTQTRAAQVLQRSIIVTINSPQNGALFESGKSVFFSGEARYQDGGYVLGGTYTWVSSIDNKFGEGGVLSSNTISQGTHTITLFVSDLDNRGESASITITITAPGLGGGEGNLGLWTGKWLLVNFLGEDDQGIWDEDDLSGIGMTAEITDTTWKETDEDGCAVTYSYSVDSDLRYTRRGIDISSQCDFVGINPALFVETGRLAFPNNNMMEDYFDLDPTLPPDEELAAFRWIRQ